MSPTPNPTSQPLSSPRRRPAKWQGGTYAVATAPAILHTYGLAGAIEFDVTADVLAGADNGWIIKKVNEYQGGEVEYYSREGAAQQSQPSIAPRLILGY